MEVVIVAILVLGSVELVVVAVVVVASLEVVVVAVLLGSVRAVMVDMVVVCGTDCCSCSGFFGGCGSSSCGGRFS